MRTEGYRPLLFGLAVATAATALLPIVVGAVVTTLDAGMAFPDWPTSDGHGMLSYPWLRSAGDKFIEHGHRLAGIVIGCTSIVFAAATWSLESRRWVRYAALLVLLAVVAQGLLGGGRVLADARRLAMFHGAFAATVFALMCSMVLVLSRSWLRPPLEAGRDSLVEPGALSPRRLALLRVSAAVTVPAILVQYALGGLIRHLGTALFEHVGMAAVVLACVLLTVFAAGRTHCRWLSRPAWLMGFIALGQLALGAGAWITKYGLASIGYVAVQQAPLQVIVRTSHTVVAMLLLASAVVLLLRALRAESIVRVGRPTFHPSAVAPAAPLGGPA
jgi:cytochrome c oxidase assembly protein subunit 15